MHRLWVLLLFYIWVPIAKAKSAIRHLKPVETLSDKSLNDDGHKDDIGLVQLFPTMFLFVNKDVHSAEMDKVPVPDLLETVKSNGKHLYEQSKALYKRLYVDIEDHEARYKKFVDMLLQTADDSGSKLVESLKERGLLDMFHDSSKNLNKLKATKQHSELPMNMVNYKLVPEIEGFYDTI